MATRQTSGTAVEPRDRATTVLHVAVAAAVVLSVFHYIDNWARFDRYALNPDSPVTEPLMIPGAWLLFTAVGVLGYVQYRRGRWWPAVAGLAVYSLSGLVGAVHYTDAPPSDFDAVQNLLIVTDVLAGAAVLAFALWLMFRRALPAMSSTDPA